jgi:hypothetical protein
MLVYITRLVREGPDERKLFEMLRSLPPLQLVPLFTSPGALHYYLYQRGMEKWQDHNKFTWNPLRIQRDIDYATYSLDTSPSHSPLDSPHPQQVTNVSSTSADMRDGNTVGGTKNQGGASTSEFPSDTEFDDEADAIASRIEFEQTLQEPNKLLKLDLLYCTDD